MRAWQVRDAGEPRDALGLAEVGEPVPEPGQVLVRVLAAPVSFPDALLCRGTYRVRPPLAFTAGIELCGEVVAVGRDVVEPRVGDRVVGSPALPAGVPAIGEAVARRLAEQGAAVVVADPAEERGSRSPRRSAVAAWRSSRSTTCRRPAARSSTPMGPGSAGPSSRGGRPGRSPSGASPGRARRPGPAHRQRQRPGPVPIAPATTAREPIAPAPSP